MPYLPKRIMQFVENCGSNVRKIKRELVCVFSDEYTSSDAILVYKNDWDYDDSHNYYSTALEAGKCLENQEAHAYSIAALKPEAFVFFLKDYIL